MFRNLLLIGLAAFFLAGSALAKDDGNSSNSGKLHDLRETVRERRVKKIDERLCKLRDHRVKEYSHRIDGLTRRLNSIKEKTALAKAGGKDVTGVETLIATAETAIGNASQAIGNLGSLTCPTPTTTNTRQLAQAALDSLKASFSDVNQALKVANKAVYDTARALVAVMGNKVTTHE